MTAERAWLVSSCGSCADAGHLPGPDEEEVSGITASGAVPYSDERHGERNKRRGAECVENQRF